MTADRLTEMLEAQRALQIKSFNMDPCELEGEALVEFLRWNQQALAAEMFEMLDEIGWKPWATSRHVNVPEAGGEMIDAWHFFMNIMLALYGEQVRSGSCSWLAGHMHARYMKKREVNARRQEEGYDGLAGKCPSCKREESLKRENLSGGYKTVYCPCGHVYSNELI